MQGDDSPAAVRLHAERHGTCSARASGPRSTPERACFTTCLEATLTWAAREVLLYLAVASPSSSRSRSPGPSASPSPVLSRARSESAAATFGSPDPRPGTAPGSARGGGTARSSDRWSPVVRRVRRQRDVGFAGHASLEQRQG
jgi:hypothetical protein